LGKSANTDWRSASQWLGVAKSGVKSQMKRSSAAGVMDWGAPCACTSEAPTSMSTATANLEGVQIRENEVSMNDDPYKGLGNRGQQDKNVDGGRQDTRFCLQSANALDGWHSKTA
jgi:hypothetical protein